MKSKVIVFVLVILLLLSQWLCLNAQEQEIFIYRFFENENAGIYLWGVAAFAIFFFIYLRIFLGLIKSGMSFKKSLIGALKMLDERFEKNAPK